MYKSFFITPTLSPSPHPPRQVIIIALTIPLISCPPNAAAILRLTFPYPPSPFSKLATCCWHGDKQAAAEEEEVVSRTGLRSSIVHLTRLPHCFHFLQRLRAAVPPDPCQEPAPALRGIEDGGVRGEFEGFSSEAGVLNLRLNRRWEEPEEDAQGAVPSAEPVRGAPGPGGLAGGAAGAGGLCEERAAV